MQAMFSEAHPTFPSHPLSSNTMAGEKDSEALRPTKTYLIKHDSHFDVSRWHHHLSPGVVKECARNALFKPIGWFFHPTYAELVNEAGGRHIWKARHHRKHRYIQNSAVSGVDRRGANVWAKVAHMGRIEYWNISWWVAQAFTWGSIVWVVNGFASFLPFCDPSHFEESSTSTGWTAFLGATIFEFGSIFGMWEAWNRDDTASFGWSVKTAFQGHHSDDAITTGRRGASDSQSGNTLEARTASTKIDDEGQPKMKWVWFSADPRYFHELGFLAAFFQLLGASIFWISGFTALPEIQDVLKEHTRTLNGAFWSPQVIGGSGFIISSTFMMLEAQKNLVQA